MTANGIDSFSNIVLLVLEFEPFIVDNQHADGDTGSMRFHLNLICWMNEILSILINYNALVGQRMQAHRNPTTQKQVQDMLRQLFWVNTNSYLIDLNNRAKTQPIIILIIHTNKQITIPWSNHLSRCNNLTPTLYSQLSLLLMVSASCSTPHPTSNTSCRSSRLLKTTRKTKCTYSLTQVPSFRWVLLYQLFAHRRG